MARVGTSRPVTFTALPAQHHTSNPVIFTAPRAYFAQAQGGSIVPVQPAVRNGDVIETLGPPA